jgi:hypothetical protein
VDGITREMFDAGRDRRFGTANPELMRVPFWDAMVRTGGYSPSWIHRELSVKLPEERGPTWTFYRMGYTETLLPDERKVRIGGEYEDFYDPDFCIYNDAVVFEPDGEFRIYGYPQELFPPIDFHTATLVGDRIILIGGLGYVQNRVPGFCPVFALDTNTFRVERLAVAGEGPGWIYHHKAELMETGIQIRGGSTIIDRDGAKRGAKNLDVLRLDLTAMRWERVEHLSGWRSFSILRRDVLDFAFSRGNAAGFDPAWLTGFDTVSVIKHDTNSTRRVMLDDVVVDLKREASSCRVRIEGTIPQERLTEFLSELVRQIEREVGVPCVVEET